LNQAVDIIEGAYMNHHSEGARQVDIVDSRLWTLTRFARSTAADAIYGSNRWSKLTIALLVLVSCGLLEVRLAASQEVPDATIEFSGGSVAAGIGYTWGRGILTYQGKHYPVKVDGLSIVHVGVSHYTASGAVYHLTQVTDINGVYTGVSAGAAVAGGASASAMKNSKGVVIQMVSTHLGLNFSLATKGVTITLYGKPI
jgi:hypothetical protein